MSRFSFKAWDKQRKMMLGCSCIEVNGNGDIMVDNRHTEINQYIPLQSTGLVDKNGKEIFEGDIVVPSDGGDYCPVKYDEEKDEYIPYGRFQVKWQNNCLAFDLVDKNNNSLNAVLSDEGNAFSMCDIEMEVIGNVYENLDLMEESK